METMERPTKPIPTGINIDAPFLSAMLPRDQSQSCNQAPYPEQARNLHHVNMDRLRGEKRQECCEDPKADEITGANHSNEISCPFFFFTDGRCFYNRTTGYRWNLFMFLKT